MNREDGVADELQYFPATGRDGARDRVEVRVENGVTSFGDVRSERAVKSRMSENQIAASMSS